ncbi:helix-turn-helix domain-containing protein [Pleomorphovibrio marinus]|uniref:helix-turn-helix domain-containing protein n=1 Tax=Pleomorphovibrio marinus TaxID=2164132 RepID=UPI000E0B166C|nr:S24 family peptidase [Pleomorphovibrio marinus]
MNDIEFIQTKMKQLGVSAYRVSQDTGITEGAISKILNGKVKQPNKATMKVLKDYFLNYQGNKETMSYETNFRQSDFILHDRQPQYREKVGENEFITVGPSTLMVVPMVEDYAEAGFLQGYKDPEFIADLPRHSTVVDKYHKGKYFAFRVKNQNMEDGSDNSIPEGSIVTGREIQKEFWNSRFHIHKHKDYIIVHKEGIIINRIKEHDIEKGVITLESLNPNKELFPDFNIMLDDCNMMFNVINISISRR